MKYKKYLYCFLISIFFVFPYLISNSLAIEHDTFFHLSRIEGYSNAIKHLDFFPKIYFNKNLGFGYAGPTFYCDIFLLIPSILYLLSFNLAFIYKLTIFSVTFLSALTMFNLINKLDKSPFSPFIASFIYLFSNYRIADTYIRGALGELMAMIFLPIILEGIFEISQGKNSYKKLALAFSGLLLSHNITFLLGTIMLIIFTVFNLNKNFLINIFKAGILGVLICLFFIIPLVFGLLSNDMYVNHYINYDLSNSTLSLNNLLNNSTTFGLGINNADPFMSINLGWILMIAPLLSIRIKSKFIKISLLIGYICILLTLNSPLNLLLKPLSVIQFSWRLNTVALPFLTICSSIGISHILNKKLFIIMLLILSIEGIYHLYPTLNRPLNITSKTTYSDIVSGKIIDKFYSAFYVRVELAGADYLPIGSPDFRKINKCIIENNKSNCNYSKKYNELIFNASKNSQIILPITYYDGYYIYYNNQKIKTFPSKDKLVSFISLDKGQYKLKYEENIISGLSKYISIFTLLFLLHKRTKRI